VHEVYSPRVGRPVLFESIPTGFCTNSSDTTKSTIVFYMTGTWSPLKMAVQPPTVQFIITPRRSVPYTWMFRAGAKNISHVMDTWSIFGKELTTNISTELTDMDIRFANPKFNLTISCSEFPKFKTELNVWQPGPNNPRNSTNWDVEITVNETIDYTAMRRVQVEGAMTIDYVGFSQPGCLSLTTTGLVVPRLGADCETNMETVCEHQSCYTREGNECVFPFTYKDVTYNNCTSVDVYQPWCATQVDAPDNTIIAWGLCLPDCEYTKPEVSCLSPPPVPRFGYRNDTNEVFYQNYHSDWFTLNFINNSDGTLNQTHHRVTRVERMKLYQPLMSYTAPGEHETNLEFFAENKDDHFNDVYQIMPNGSIAVYTCPDGWVFQNSNNISHTARCLDWNWIADFNTSMPCVRK
jgi:hypothetical protein